MSTLPYVGVDGGGTRARAVVVDEARRELARLVGPAGLVDPRDPSAAAAAVAQLVRDALDAAGMPTAAVLCCGLAGAGRPQEREAVRVALVLEGVAERVRVVGDAEAAMADAFPERAGVLVVSGTGSIAWTRSSDGTAIRVGGWGMILGDDGSGYAIGVAALRAVARAQDRMIPPTMLSDLILAELGVREPIDLIAWAASATKAQFAALAPVVVRCAERGDAAAAAVRDDAVRALVQLAAAAARQAGTATPRFAFAGGLIAPGGPLRPAAMAGLQQEIPGAAIASEPVDAAMGAARLALGE